MAKVFGIHKVTLKPGVNGDDFEAFFRTSGSYVPISDDWKVYLVKGDRGDREGKYLLLFEINSVEARDRDAPADDSQEVTPQSEGEEAFFREWLTYARAVTDPAFTDYVVVAEHPASQP